VFLRKHGDTNPLKFFGTEKICILPLPVETLIADLMAAAQKRKEILYAKFNLS